MNQEPSTIQLNKDLNKVLVTGAAGFIGYHLVNRLLAEGLEVTGLDNINDYYDVNLKYARLAEAGIAKEEIKWGVPVRSHKHPGYSFVRMHLEDARPLQELFSFGKFDCVVNLAAQAGVRYSLTNPEAYIQSNIVGFANILEACRHQQVKHLVYASSSSVYGLNEAMPFSTSHNVDHPVSLYAASKKSNELMAHTYSHLYHLPTTGLRFFTVYGPWGRPDMALYLFADAMLQDQPIKVFNHGNMLRDFTYIDDIVEGVFRVINKIPAGNPDWSGKNPDPGSSAAPYKIYNIGNNQPVKLLDFIRAIEQNLGKKAKMDLQDLQPGDVPATYADVSDLVNDLGYKPQTPVELGIQNFVNWFKTWKATAPTH